jgi:AcrR family transcriptional regulator
MSKGEATKQAILEQSMELAAVVGLEGLSIGQLAEQLKLSKSGLFAHFKSKELLQIETLRAATEKFIEEVVMPALKRPRGEPRVRALWDYWNVWGRRKGGCLFLASIYELDDRPGPTRDALIQSQNDWLDTLATAAQIAVKEKHFRQDLDCKQFAFEGYSLLMGAHFLHRFIQAPDASTRTQMAFERLLKSAKP